MSNIIDMNKQNNIWYFGNGAGIDFTNLSSPNSITSPVMNTFKGCSSVCDPITGDLLFYTDGSTVWDKNHNIITTGLSGSNNSTTSAFIIPNDWATKQYYILTVGTGSTNVLNYTLLDANSPSISIVTGQKNRTIATSTTDKIAVTRLPNCDGYWILTGRHRSNAFNRIKLDSSGFSSSQVVFNGARPQRDGGYMKFSPDGTKLAVANRYRGYVQLFDFNSATGTASGMRDISFSNCYGIEFSPNSNFLYYAVSNTSLGNTDVYQADTSGPLSPRSIGLLPNTTGGYTTGAFQLAPNQKIYIALDGETSLATIDAPNISGLGANLMPNAITLASPSQCRLGLPSHYYGVFCPETSFPESELEDCHCNGCNENAEVQNKELTTRLGRKSNNVKATNNPSTPFCSVDAVASGVDLRPLFYWHWGDSSSDQIEEHDTEVFYLTVCNNFRDIQYNGLKITKIHLIPNLPIADIQITPDRFVYFDCLKPCSCQSREFVLITRGRGIAGNYTLELEYCIESISLKHGKISNKASFPLDIIKD